MSWIVARYVNTVYRQVLGEHMALPAAQRRHRMPRHGRVERIRPEDDSLLARTAERIGMTPDQVSLWRDTHLRFQGQIRRGRLQMSARRAVRKKYHGR